MEGPKVTSEAPEAALRLWGVAAWLLSIRGSGGYGRRKFFKNQLEIAYFCTFAN